MSMPKKLKSQAIAKSHEPSAKEATALAQYDQQSKQRPALPSLKVTMSTKGGKHHARIEIDHPDTSTGYKLLSVALGGVSRGLLVGIIDDLACAAQEVSGINADKLNFGIEFVRDANSTDSIEAALAVQMAAVHIATMKTAANLGGSRTWEMRDQQERSLNRLTRTFAAQVEALKRYRSKGEQRVYVERVNVAEGGQAIVGNVDAGGGVGGPFKNAN